MFKVDTRQLLAAVTVADEGSLSRAAIRLNITQSAVSKQILALEAYLGFELFTRNNRRLRATTAGEVFTSKARVILQLGDQAVQQSREVHAGAQLSVHLGKSPYTDPFLISGIHAIQRTEFPELRIDVESNFSPELQREVLAGVLDMAVLTEGGPDPSLSTLELARCPLFVLLREEHEAALKQALRLSDFNGQICIRFARHVHPDLYDRLSKLMERSRIQPRSVHHVTTAEEAVQLVLEEDGLAVLTQVGAWRVLENGVTMRPLRADSLDLATVLVVRADTDSAVIGNLVRAIGKKFSGRKRTIWEGHAWTQN